MAVKFLCENCRYEVPLDDDRCPFCGKTFYSVYCPRCRHEGMPVEFRNGCPKCGYMKEGVKSYLRRPARDGKKGTKVQFPRWSYFLTALVLLSGIIGLLVYIFTHR
jgi:hypothetical protein